MRSDWEHWRSCNPVFIPGALCCGPAPAPFGPFVQGTPTDRMRAQTSGTITARNPRVSEARLMKEMRQAGGVRGRQIACKMRRLNWDPLHADATHHVMHWRCSRVLLLQDDRRVLRAAPRSCRLVRRCRRSRRRRARAGCWRRRRRRRRGFGGARLHNQPLPCRASRALPLRIRHAGRGRLQGRAGSCQCQSPFPWRTQWARVTVCRGV